MKNKRKTVPFAIATKINIYLGINLLKNLKGLQTENYKVLKWVGGGEGWGLGWEGEGKKLYLNNNKIKIKKKKLKETQWNGKIFHVHGLAESTQ